MINNIDKKDNLRIIILSGPTASGKTELSFELFDRLLQDGKKPRLINMDSAQIYKDMNIGTAKVTKEELKRYPLELISFLSPENAYSVANFLNDLNKIIKDCNKKGEVPIVVGGTMMYLNALINGISDLPEKNDDIRSTLYNELEKEGGRQKLYKELLSIDKEASKRINIEDTQRLIRFIELYRITKTPPSKLWQKQIKKQRFLPHHIAIIPEKRLEIHQKIAKRFKKMLKDGLIDEVINLKNKYRLSLDNQSIRSVGYRQVWMYLNGSLNYKDLEEKGIIATRQLAKRQITWLRKIEKTEVILNNKEFNYNNVLKFIETE